MEPPEESRFFVPPPSPELDLLHRFLSLCCFDEDTNDEIRSMIRVTIGHNKELMQRYLVAIETILAHPHPEQLLGAELWMVVEHESGHGIGGDQEARDYLQFLATTLHEFIAQGTD